MIIIILTLSLLIVSSHAQSVRSPQPTPADTLLVLFPFNSATLNPNDSANLTKFLETHPPASLISLSAQTDTLGSIAYNNRLAGKRAAAILKIINKQNRPNLPISILAKTGPRQSPDSLNRRALLIASANPGSSISSNKPAIDSNKLSIDNNKGSIDSIPGSADNNATAIDTIISLDNVYFLTDQPILTGSSRLALPSYIQLLKLYKRKHIEVRGHCNYIGKLLPEGHSLFKLSVKRAQLIYDALIDAGFNPKTLSYKGVGNHEPKHEHPTSLEEEKENMRVEIIVFKR